MNRQANGGPGSPGRPGSPVRRQARRLSRTMVAAGAAILVASTGTAAAGTAFAGTAAQAAAAHPAALPSGGALSAARGSGVPRPLVIGPITGGAHGRPLPSSPLPVNPARYLGQACILRGPTPGYA